MRQNRRKGRAALVAHFWHGRRMPSFLSTGRCYTSHLTINCCQNWSSVWLKFTIVQQNFILSFLEGWVISGLPTVHRSPPFLLVNWQISVNISKMVQDRYTYNGRLIGNSIWPIKWQQRQWPWRSFTGCRPFQMQSVGHLCSILHDFNRQCACMVPLH